MSLWVHICAYKAEDFICASLDQWSNLPGISRIIVSITEKPWSVPYDPTRTHHAWALGETALRPTIDSKDETEDLIRVYFPDVTILKGDWSHESDQRRHMMEMTVGQAWGAVIADVDEFYTGYDWDKVLNIFPSMDFGLTVQMKTFVWSMNTVLHPPDTWEPTILVRPEKVNSYSYRIMGGGTLTRSDITMYHFSWLGPLSRIKEKALRSLHWTDFKRSWWYALCEGQFKYDDCWPYIGEQRSLEAWHAPAEIRDRIQGWMVKLGRDPFPV